MVMVELSIIVPIYGVESYLDQCIKSILNQQYREFELILVNDGSKDKCAEICDYYATIDSRVKVVHKSNGGLVSARKAGLAIAKGEYVTYVDGDDWLELNMYSDLMSKLRTTQADIIVEGYLYDYAGGTINITNSLKSGIYNKKQLINHVYPKMLSHGEFYKPGIFPVVWNKIYRRKILISAQMEVPNNISIGEDVAVTYRAIIEANTVQISDGCHYHYRTNMESMTKKYDSNYFSKIDSLIKYINKILPLEKYDLEEQMNMYTCSLVYMGICQECEPRNIFISWKNRKEVLIKLEKINWNTCFNQNVMDNMKWLDKVFLLKVKNKKLNCAKFIFLIRKIAMKLKRN